MLFTIICTAGSPVPVNVPFPVYLTLHYARLSRSHGGAQPHRHLSLHVLPSSHPLVTLHDREYQDQNRDDDHTDSPRTLHDQDDEGTAFSIHRT